LNNWRQFSIQDGQLGQLGQLGTHFFLAIMQFCRQVCMMMVGAQLSRIRRPERVARVPAERARAGHPRKVILPEASVQIWKKIRGRENR
jgi:hypothetical protein